MPSAEMDTRSKPIREPELSFSFRFSHFVIFGYVDSHTYQSCDTENETREDRGSVTDAGPNTSWGKCKSAIHTKNF